MPANLLNRLVTLLAAVLLLSTFFSFLNTIGFIVLSAATVFFGILLRPDILQEKPFQYICLFIAIELLYSLFNYGNSTNMVIYYALFFISSVILCFDLDYLSNKQKRFLLLLLFGSLAVVITATFLALLTDSTILRTFAYGSDSQNETSHPFIYSYGVGEALCIILPFILAFALSTNKLLLRLIALYVVVMGCATQFMGTLMTSALLSLVFCVLVLISYAATLGYSNFIKYIIGLAVVVVILEIFIPQLSLGENLQLMSKMEDMQYSLSSGQSVGQVGSRSDLYKQSFQVCLHNPILGLGVPSESFGIYGVNNVSMHTSILDYWGMYGLFSLFLISAWKRTSSYQLSVFDEKEKRYFRWGLFSLLFLLLLKGPVTIGINFLYSTFVLGIIASTIHSEQDRI